MFGLVVLAFSATFAWGQTVLCTEDFVTGCVADVFQGGFPGFEILVASDGESAFDPFGAGFDTSDGIQFGPEFFGGFTFIGQPGWVQIDPNTWVLPADLTAIGCGIENEPTCEPLGNWVFLGQSWIAEVIGTYQMLSSDGVTVSDTIILNNNGPDGSAQILFTSDPGPAPEPATLALLGAGLAGLAFSRRRR